MDRPALKRLMADIEAGKVDCVVVYKVDRLSRSLLDFARMMETFEKHHVSFVSRHPAVQHDHLDGPADAERPAVVRPVRAGDHLGADAGQDRRHPPQGQVVGRDAAAGLRRRPAGLEADRQRGRGRAGAGDLRVVPGAPVAARRRSRNSTAAAGTTSGGRPARATSAAASRSPRPACTSC